MMLSERRFGEFFKIRHGYAFKSEYYSHEGKYILLTPGNFYEEGGFRSKGVKETYYIGDVPKGSILKKDDLLVAMTEQAEGLLGSSVLVPEDDLYLHNQRLGLIIDLDEDHLDKRFLYHVFNSRDVRRQIHESAGGTKVRHTSPDKILSTKFFYHSLPIQRKIADILSRLDKRMDFLTKLISAKSEFRRGIMQQLLTRRKQFKEFKGQEWGRMKLSDFTKLTLRTTPKPNSPFKSLGIRSHGKGTFLKEDFEPGKIELTELYEVRQNDLIVNITFAWEGAIAIAGATDSGALVSHRFPTYVFDAKQAIPEYFRYVVLQKRFVEKLGLISPGGAGRNRVLSKKDFANLEVLMPSIEEQRKIASVLNTCDRELDLLREQLAELKKQKKGLMQKLLTGQIRIKVDEAQAIGA